MKNNYILIVAILLLLPIVAAAQDEIPDIRNATIFHGRVTIDGSAVPDGTSVEAKAGNVLRGQDSDGTMGGNYNLGVFARTETITFYINGKSAQTYNLRTEDKTKNINLDLSITTGGGTGGSSGGGGPGGGGGVASGEKSSNIEVKECYDMEFFKDRLISYKYSHLLNPTRFINITGSVNAGVITSCVEVLKDTSSLVTSGVPGVVYKNMNIWVGLKGFTTQNNIKDAKIVFKVNNAWLTNNNVAVSQIKLLKWDGSKWVTLDTSQTGKDETSLYFESGTTSFSSFAISGIKEITEITVTPTPGPIPSPGVTGTSAPPVNPPMSWNWLLYLMVVIIIGAAAFFFIIKKK